MRRLIILVVLLVAGTANAATITIGTANYKGQEYGLVYEADQHLVWLNYADHGGGDWYHYVNWAAGLGDELSYNIDPGVGVSWNGAWRLPKVAADYKSSELSHLFYESEGLTPATWYQGSPINLLGAAIWTETDYWDNGAAAMIFNAHHGVEAGFDKTYTDFYAFAVRSADVTAVPEPSAFVLCSLGAIGIAIGWWRRKRTV